MFILIILIRRSLHKLIRFLLKSLKCLSWITIDPDHVSIIKTKKQHVSPDTCVSLEQGWHQSHKSSTCQEVVECNDHCWHVALNLQLLPLKSLFTHSTHTWLGSSGLNEEVNVYPDYMQWCRVFHSMLHINHYHFRLQTDTSQRDLTVWCWLKSCSLWRMTSQR